MFRLCPPPEEFAIKKSLIVFVFVVLNHQYLAPPPYDPLLFRSVTAISSSCHSKNLFSVTVTVFIYNQYTRISLSGFAPPCDESIRYLVLESNILSICFMNCHHCFLHHQFPISAVHFHRLFPFVRSTSAPPPPSKQFGNHRDDVLYIDLSFCRFLLVADTVNLNRVQSVHHPPSENPMPLWDGLVPFPSRQTTSGLDSLPSFRSLTTFRF